MDSNEVCVPVAAVSAAGEGEGEGVAPAVGDEVEVTLGGKVSRVEGDQVYFTAESANGVPMAQAKPAGGPMAGGDDEASMDAMMEGEKARVGYV